MVTSLTFLKLGDGEESNLHTLEETDDAHEKEEENDGDGVWNTFPHGSLALEESTQGDSKAECQDGDRQEAADPEPKLHDGSTFLFAALNWLSREPTDEERNEVGGMQETGPFDGHGNVDSEDCKVVVDVVKHAVGSVDLRSKLTNHGGVKDHGQTSNQEDLGDDFRKSPELRTSERSTAQVDDKDNEKNHELTSKEVAIEVVTLVGGTGNLVGHGMRFLVEIAVDRCQTNDGRLATFHHGEPEYCGPDDNEGKGRVDIRRETCLFGEDQSHNDRSREDEKTR